MDYLHSKGIYVSAPCGGHGTCGKCRIRVNAGTLPVTDTDRALLSEAEINERIRLACKAVPVSPVRISVLNSSSDENMQMAEDFTPADKDDKDKGRIHTDLNSGDTENGRISGGDKNLSYDHKAKEKTDHQKETGSREDAQGVSGACILKKDNEYGIAIDLGTTTLAASLVDMTEKKVLLTRSAVNRQRAFGADVMSRMMSALNGKAEDMKRVIEKDLLLLIGDICASSGADVSRLIISGNTCMYHLLMEYDVSGLSKFPFTPVSLGGEEFTRDQVFSYETEKRNALSEDSKVYLVPGFSAFVGGDIASGLIACDLAGKDSNVFFIDIGTNAEMVLKRGGDYLSASAAAGPALEGGNLKWGTGSVAGAICGVEIFGDPQLLSPTALGNNTGTDDRSAKKLKITTISDAAPVGICGTGALEAVHGFLRAGIINGYGTFTKEEYLENGFPLARSVMGDMIGLDQDDVRQIQMAKAAICAGAEMLLKAGGVKADELDRVIVSGGFGSFLDMKKAGAIGLLPEELAAKAEAVGNTSLKGAVMMLTEDNTDKINGIRARVSLYDLANDDRFKDRYIECMNFI